MPENGKGLYVCPSCEEKREFSTQKELVYILANKIQKLNFNFQLLNFFKIRLISEKHIFNDHITVNNDSTPIKKPKAEKVYRLFLNSIILS